MSEEIEHGIFTLSGEAPLSADKGARGLGFFRAVDFITGERRVSPEINVELRIVGHLNTVPVLWWTGGKIARVYHHFHFRLYGMLIGKSVISHSSFHDAQLAKNIGGGVMVTQQRGWDVLKNEKWG